MQTPYSGTSADLAEDTRSPISWSAIFGGTAAAIALSLILFAFGAGMGFAFGSPMGHDGMKHVTYMAIVWMIVVQWLSSGLGGYITGRLRTKWNGVHNHEVFFRDTAHGFLTWSVATVIGAMFLISGSSSMHAMHHEGPMNDGPVAYYVDDLFRSERLGQVIDQETKAETTHLLMKGLKDDGLSVADKDYLGRLVSMHTGVEASTADKRVDATLAEMHTDADQAKKTTATISIFTLLSMFVGAFIASVASALGGQERDLGYLSVREL